MKKRSISAMAKLLSLFFFLIVLFNLTFYFSSTTTKDGFSISELIAKADPDSEGTGAICPSNVPGCGTVTASGGNFIITCAKHGGFHELGACKVKHSRTCTVMDHPEFPIP